MRGRLIQHGSILVHPGVDERAHDFRSIYDSAVHFAAMEKEVEILPHAHPKSVEYRLLFAALVGTRYEGKSPDFRTIENGICIYYEHEGFKPESKQENRLRNMLSRGLQQSSRIVIEDEGSTMNHITKLINFRVKTGDVIDEVWVRKDSGLLVRAY